MSNYAIAWTVILVMAIAGGAVMWMLARSIRLLPLRLVLLMLPVMFFVTPVAIPGHEGLAPAFVVAVFEAFFQTEGRPGGAFVALGLGLSSGLILALILGIYLQRRNTARALQSPPEAGHDPEV